VTRILLARHGQSEWNAVGRWQGQADPPLTALGRTQAAALAEKLAGELLDAILSSDLARAFETAQIVARSRWLTVETDARLREIDCGEWSGLTTEEIQARYPEGWARQETGGDGWEHGETHEAMSARIVAEVSRVAAERPEATLLLVLHGGVIRALLAHAHAMPLSEYRQRFRGPANAAVAPIAVERGVFRPIE
jgi:broad specificity phosphatase PhoE